jgi:hypothetical protein
MFPERVRLDKEDFAVSETRLLNKKIVALNAANALFWKEQSELSEIRMADDVICEIALRDLASEMVRGVQVYSRKSLEQALQDADANRSLFIKQRAQSTARADRMDALQRLIVGIVRNNPNIGIEQLLAELRRPQGGAIIDDIDDELIHFKDPVESTDHDGRPPRKIISRNAPISGLKHRLTRARKKAKK